MIEASCHCGAVKIAVPHAPETVTDCNCSLCRRVCGLWSYYPPCEVTVSGATDTYMWGDRMLTNHRCRVCGIATHWTPVDPAGDRMGVNARLMPPEIVDAARIRRVDGANDWAELD